MVKIVASGVEILPPKNTTKTYDHKPFTAWKRKTPIPTNKGTPSRSSYFRQFEKFNLIRKKKSQPPNAQIIQEIYKATNKTTKFSTQKNKKITSESNP